MGTLGTFSVFIFLGPFILNGALGNSPAVQVVYPDCVCSVPRCPPNEEHRCREPCPPETCITLYAAFDCIANQTCKPGCYCKKGFLRTTTNGTCVRSNQCPPLKCANDPNAKKGCGIRCGKSCEDYNDKSKICPPMPCQKDGCECKDGFVYDKNVDLCTKPEKCTKQCTKPHERYSSCLLGECVPKTCEDLGKSLACPAIAGPCAGGCICEKGYVRDSKGNCINAKTCPPVCPKNEERGCRLPCPPETCITRYLAIDCIANQTGVEGCYCKQGYLRTGPNGTCIPENDCSPPKQCTKPNERYTRCLLGECIPKTCEDLGKPLACPAITKPCAGGCICKEGYVRDAKGNCIDKKKCTSCGGDHNAVSGCGNHCGKSCDSLDGPNKMTCPRFCDTNGCDCKEGYLFNKATKKCTLIKDCPNYVEHCPRNEQSGCRKPCPPETCFALYAAIRCIENQTCVKGCFCKPGYLRTSTNGTCVPKNQCPPLECLGDPNSERGCGIRCGKTCADYKENKICPLGPCKSNGCDCKKGFVYDYNLMKCVKPSQCTKQCTKPNERYSECLLGECIPKTCEDLGKPLACPAIAAPCAGGCICKEGYVRDSNGNCIDKTTCSKCGDDPYAVSGCGNPCGKTCDSINKTDIVCPQYCETNGCDCRPGYLLNSDTNKCTLIKDCPKPGCGGDPNAVHGCGNPCGKTCDSINKTNLICPQYCKSDGCDCKKGFLLNTVTNKCTPIKDCPKPNQCDKNEEFYCGVSCPEASCDNPKPPICINKRCELKCFCKKGFVRDANKKCIPANKCPVICNKPHERYSECLPGQCGPKTCDDLGRPISCPFIVGPCPGGCICEEGYLRAANGTCIEQGLCPPKPCSTNQTWVTTCNGLCPDSFCPRNDKPLPACEPLLPCYPGCQCKLNYRLNATRSCILAPECPAINCTRQNEKYNSCPSTCLSENCEDINNQPTVCNTLIWLCSPRCICKKGHFRNKDGLCIPASQCPEACPNPNEKYVNCLPGQCKPKTCDELINPAPCPRVRPPCPGGCICVDGYVRDANGVCIKKESCPKNCTGPNEQYSDCVNGKCTPTNCKEIGQISKCPTVKPGTCSSGCICKRGYVRSSNGTCIAINDCPEAGKCVSKNATWVQCAVNCGPAFCPKNDQPQPICFPPAGLCSPGCKCKENYRIDANNKCILASECSPVPCTRPNEEFSSCPPNGVTSCSQLGTKLSPNDGPKICRPACICKKGFYRNGTNICVPECDCQTEDSNVPRKCPPNEVLKSRVSCPPDTCDTMHLSYLCIADQVPSVVCTCKDGYLRTNSTGVCVPTDRCLPPECMDDPYAQSGCGNRCKKTCSDYNDTNKICNNNVCKLFGCDCKEGFVYDESKKRCVKPSQCPKQCSKPHERYTSCLLGECIPKTCDDLGRPIACPSIASPCAGGCICEEGYVRDYKGNCIDKKSCRRCGDDPNAESGCGNPCGKTCASLNINQANLFCPLYCDSNGCDCKKGYLLNTDTNKCVLEKDCPKPIPQCGLNEEYYCGRSCPEATCQSPEPPQCLNKKCKLGCFCKKGSVRDANNKCIPLNKCPSLCKGPHERHVSCPAGQCDAKTCDNLVNPAPCPRIIPPCPSGCICEEGYLRDSRGICIEKSKCPQLACNANQTYVSCAINCSDKRCPEDDQPQPVCDPPRNCTPGCTCKINYRLDKSGKCIQAIDCPAINCTRQNEEYASCSSDCLAENCEDADQPSAVCNTLLLNCQPKCICKKGHFRNSEGLCVPAKDCPSVCKDPNAEWKDCKSPCPGTCQETRPVCLSKACTAGCQCKEGYVLSKKGGKCLPIDTCADYVECGANQTFVPCTFPCPQGRCPESDQIILCKPPRDCSGGCGCKENYRYNANDECILGSDCPPVECTGKNQEWAPCRSEYDWERCEDRFNSPPFVPDDGSYCNPRCVCIKGHYKNNNYECVPESECPPIS